MAVERRRHLKRQQIITVSICISIDVHGAIDMNQFSIQTFCYGSKNHLTNRFAKIEMEELRGNVIFGSERGKCAWISKGFSAD